MRRSKIQPTYGFSESELIVLKNLVADRIETIVDPYRRPPIVVTELLKPLLEKLGSES